MHHVWTGVLWAIGSALLSLNALKAASLVHGLIWVIRRGHDTYLDAKQRNADGVSFRWEDLELAHGHRALLQSRLHRVKPSALRRTIGVLYFVYVLVPTDLCFVMTVWLSSPRSQATRGLALAVGLTAALVAILLLINEAAKAAWFGEISPALVAQDPGDI